MTLDMTKGKPLALLIRFAVPLMIGNIFQQLYNLVDTVIVGRFVGADALAAVGTTGIVCFLMCSLMIGLSVGAGIVVSQFFGVGNIEKLKSAVVSLIWLTVIVTVTMSLIGFFGARAFLTLLQVPENILEDAVAYLQICSAFLLGMALYNATASILRSVGDSKTPLIAMVVSSVTNVGLNFLFVLVFRMGVKGVAYGTVISQIISAVICMERLIKNRKEIGLENLPLVPDKDMVWVIVRAGIPSAVQSSLISLGGISVQGLVNTFGTSTMAAYAAVVRIDSIAVQIVVAIANALSVFTGQNIGLGYMDRIKEALYKTLALMMGICVALGVLVFLFRRPMLSLFLDPVEAAEAIEIGCEYMMIIGVAYVISGVMNSYLNVIRGAGDVNASFLAGIAEIAGRLVFAYLLVIPLGTLGIWLATPLSWGCGCIYSVYRYYSGKWKDKKFV